MKTLDFNFELPDNLVAQVPTAERGQSRLMVLDRETRSRKPSMVSELPAFLEKGTLLVFNNSKVRKARLLGTSESTGAEAEFLLLKQIDDFSWQVLAKRSKRRKPGTRYVFEGGVKAVVSPVDWAGRVGESSSSSTAELVLCFDNPIDDEWLDRWGHIPLPPYIKRKDTPADSERYQTVYASQWGSAAAPTAGLHFTDELLRELDNAGMERVFITLHVGLGTFLPVRTENIEEHHMHEEAFYIGEEEALKIEKAKRDKRKVLAVGTTSLRTLESAWRDGLLRTGGKGHTPGGKGHTSIFIYPGFEFHVADQLFTNFHTPMSTLLMLVSAFADRELILESYQEAIKEGYRFYSYGDAMLIR